MLLFRTSTFLFSINMAPHQILLNFFWQKCVLVKYKLICIPINVSEACLQLLNKPPPKTSGWLVTPHFKKQFNFNNPREANKKI